eukprot:CAMPEP_0175081916 /NCGR_PEP_ID=MMETSP0052_2-20121109/26442_1 /TAXON_ID=51329 ORGANISM="Polytomella parva, Strain SAG 63-3" /NCGR_SAMPLE_ID=MMETSP0052_2 /ASSEMBLY_ACC=CAM_ASM_000194 /LENGTH=215 /DNA_ID=CAMNT_0016353007 /DNA_START=85 /DNA_END=729 /DNA_ORIENTATION=+
MSTIIIPIITRATTTSLVIVIIIVRNRGLTQPQTERFRFDPGKIQVGGGAGGGGGGGGGVSSSISRLALKADKDGRDGGEGGKGGGGSRPSSHLVPPLRSLTSGLSMSSKHSPSPSSLLSRPPAFQRCVSGSICLTNHTFGSGSVATYRHRLSLMAIAALSFLHHPLLFRAAAAGIDGGLGDWERGEGDGGGKGGGGVRSSLVLSLIMMGEGNSS